MRKVRAGDVELEYEERGAGEPLVLIHGGFVADTFVPLMDQPALDGYLLVRYRRRGMAGSTKTSGPVSIADQAADCVGLMDALGIERAHVAGHSYGGSIALQLALDAPARVRSLVLLEPALFGVPAADEFMSRVTPALEAFGAGDRTAAVDRFMRVVGGDDCIEAFESSIPGGIAQAIADCDFVFEVEFAALMEWTFGPDEAAHIGCPSLYVLGTESGAFFEQGRDLILSAVPGAEEAVLPRLDHLLQVRDAGAVAGAVRSFLARHPITVLARS